MSRFFRDRSGLAFAALLVVGLAVLGAVLAVVLTRGGEQAAPPPTTTSTSTTTSTTTTATSTTTPATTSTTTPATTAAPSTTAPAPPAPAGPLQAASVGPFSATVRWTGPNPPARVAYGLADLGPTIWAPMTNGEAVLSGLTFSTAYRAWAGDATLDFTTAPPPASPAAAIGGGAILLDGQPFFPLLVLTECKHGYDQNLAAGITLFVENQCGGIAAQTAAVGGKALSLTSADEAGIGGNGVIGWYYPDEADLKRMTGDTLPSFPTLAATARLRVLTLSNHVYSRTEPLAEGRGVYPGLIEKADVVGLDLYPLQEFCSASWLPDVAAAQRELVGLAGGRPTFQWIEAETWRCHEPDLQVTPATVQTESWLAVAGGARGLGFFPAGWDPSVTPGIEAVARMVAALGAALAAPDAPVSASGPVVAGGRALNGALYVVAVNPTHAALRATLTAPGLNGRTLRAIGEGRSVGAAKDVFHDDFDPLAVHLYVAAPG